MESIDDLEVLDRAAALANVDGDAELLAEMAALFLEDYPRQVSALREAIAQGDAKGVMHYAHTLKGSVGNFAARQAQEAAFKLESAGRQDDLSEAGQLYQALDQALQRLHKVMASLIQKKATTGA